MPARPAPTLARAGSAWARGLGGKGRLIGSMRARVWARAWVRVLPLASAVMSLASAGSLALAQGAMAAAAAPVTSVHPLAISEVAPGVYVHFGAIDDWLPSNGGDVANIGFVVGNRCVAVVDTGGTPQVGRALLATIRQTTALPVCYVINTHAHPDHILGDSAFAGLPAPTPTSTPTTAPRFVASAKYNAALSGRERYYRNALQRDFGITLDAGGIVYPTLAVDTRMELDLGNRVLMLQAWPTAHTDHDLTVYDRSTRTLFLADLLFVRHIPVVDGSLRGWIHVMADLKQLDVALAIPGHGPASADWPGVMAPQEAYLGALLRETRSAIKQHKTIDEAVDQVGNGAAASWALADRFHRRNVTAAYAELEWDD